MESFTKITTLTVLVTLITPSYTHTIPSILAPVDNLSTITAIGRNVPVTLSTKDQEMTTKTRMHDVSEPSSDTLLTSGQEGVTFDKTIGPGETIRDFDETKKNETLTQMVTARTNLHQTTTNSTTIIDKENTIFVTKLNQSVIESASEKSYSSESPDKPIISESVTRQQNALSSLSSIPVSPSKPSSKDPTMSLSTKVETIFPTTNLEPTQVKTSSPVTSTPTGSPRPTTAQTKITQPNSITTPTRTSSTIMLSTEINSTQKTTSQTTISTIGKSTTSTILPSTTIKPTTTVPRTTTSAIAKSATSTILPSPTIKPTATVPRTTTSAIAKSATSTTSPRLRIKSTTTLARTTTTQPTTTSTLSIRATTMQFTKSSTLKATNHKTSRGSFTLTTTNQYVNEINHLNSNISELDNQVTSLTAAVVVLSLFLATSLVLIAVYYIRIRFRPPKSPFDKMNMTEVATKKQREDERRGPFFGITDNIFRVSTATLGENDHPPVSADTFKPPNSAGNSSRGSASLTIGGNIEERSVL